MISNQRFKEQKTIKTPQLQVWNLCLMMMIAAADWKSLTQCHYKTCGPDQVAFHRFPFVTNEDCENNMQKIV